MRLSEEALALLSNIRGKHPSLLHKKDQLVTEAFVVLILFFRVGCGKIKLTRFRTKFVWPHSP